MSKEAPRAKTLDLSLYFVTDPRMPGERGLPAVVAAALRGGITILQLRDKEASDEDFLAMARSLAPLARGAGIPFLLNDRPHLVEAAGADGVHVGQEDTPVPDARRLIGPERILGLSVETPSLAAAVDPAVVDYAGIGPVSPTTTKSDHKAPLGLDGLAEARARCPVPAVAIGGIGHANAADIMKSGVDGIAVVSAICAASDPEEAARALRSTIREATR
ncbi:MAG: thiamine phosphate synthase [Pseudomonadota bacterium]